MGPLHKRKKHDDHQAKDVSPPPAKRKVLATANQKQVASFFTPASQKDPQRVQWRTVNDSLLIAKYHSDDDAFTLKRRKVAGFDLDSTLITSISGKLFSKDVNDWKWWDYCVPGELRKLHDSGYQVVIFTNQGGLSQRKDSKTAKSDQKRLSDFKTKVHAVLDSLDLPISVYVATQRDKYRKPRDGMWKEMLEDYDLEKSDALDVTKSLFVGDAAGRQGDEDGMGKKDFACSDRDFAANLGIKFMTPEEYFLETEARGFKRTFEPSEYLTSVEGGETKPRFSKKNSRDLVIFCGSPGVGKSTFFWTELRPLGYDRINQDILKTRDKCLKKAEEILNNGKSVAVDNTNPDPETRAHWVRLAQKLRLPIRCIHLLGDAKLCEHNNTVRALNGSLMNPESRAMLPVAAFLGYAQRFSQPKTEEGFQDITTVEFRFIGTNEQKAVWSRFWI